jgi:hypothetical protein
VASEKRRLLEHIGKPDGCARVCSPAQAPSHECSVWSGYYSGSRRRGQQRCWRTPSTRLAAAFAFRTRRIARSAPDAAIVTEHGLRAGARPV